MRIEHVMDARTTEWQETLEKTVHRDHPCLCNMTITRYISSIEVTIQARLHLI